MVQPAVLQPAVSGSPLTVRQGSPLAERTEAICGEDQREWVRAMVMERRGGGERKEGRRGEGEGEGMRGQVVRCGDSAWP